ncbi:unnamed protein product [Caenorhabditis auriculariae]|uniref:Uncharacterized protein n=1 Tax=Caenorhabditis auriculariae TaxID=2777116 RepID=A0A8S1H9Q9_9PELO|nr:unnamed protein product [Caenorhabditis auriculariae]
MKPGDLEAETRLMSIVSPNLSGRPTDRPPEYCKYQQRLGLKTLLTLSGQSRVDANANGDSVGSRATSLRSLTTTFRSVSLPLHTLRLHSIFDAIDFRVAHLTCPNTDTLFDTSRL